MWGVESANPGKGDNQVLVLGAACHDDGAIHQDDLGGCNARAQCLRLVGQGGLVFEVSMSPRLGVAWVIKTCIWICWRLREVYELKSWANCWYCVASASALNPIDCIPKHLNLSMTASSWCIVVQCQCPNMIIALQVAWFQVEALNNEGSTALGRKIKWLENGCFWCQLVWLGW